jgi:hypothetical protein
VCDVQARVLPTVTVGECFGEDVGTHVNGWTVLDREVALVKGIVQEAQVDAMRSFDVAQSLAPTCLDDAHGAGVILHEPAHDLPLEQSLPEIQPGQSLATDGLVGSDYLRLWR